MIYTAAKANAEDNLVFICGGEPNFVGSGSFCGWYSEEKFLDCDVIGCVDWDKTFIEFSLYEEPRHYDELLINSIYQCKKFEAESDADAINKLTKIISDYRDKKESSRVCC